MVSTKHSHLGKLTKNFNKSLIVAKRFHSPLKISNYVHAI